MRAEDAIAIMLAGGSSSTEFKIPKNISYYDYSSSIYDYEYNGEGYIYGDTRTVPKDSIVLQYTEEWYNENNRYCYRYSYRIYQLIIEDIDIESEEVVGILDLQTNTEYRFQFNAKGQR